MLLIFILKFIDYKKLCSFLGNIILLYIVKEGNILLVEFLDYLEVVVIILIGYDKLCKVFCINEE